jgi:RNA polymerase sigma-70 factor (ECF subfamily)
LVKKLFASVNPGFSPRTWEAFRRLALHGVPAARVAKELDMAENVFLLAKTRVIRRLREEAVGLLR